MKALFTTLALLLAGSLTGCQTAEAKRQKDYARSWETWETVDVEVVGYEKGPPDAFLAVTWGSLCGQLYPSNISTVKIISPSAFTGGIYSVSVPDGLIRDFDPAPWRATGGRFHITLPLTYLKYRPWGFIPYTAIQGLPRSP